MKTPTLPELENSAELADLLASLIDAAKTDPKARAFLLTYAPWAASALSQFPKS